MYKACCLLALCALAAAAPIDETTTKRPFVDIIEQSSEKHEDGSYHFLFRGEDGSFREETAVVVNPGTEDEYLEVTGSYSFFDADGMETVVHYKADNHGFVPEGSNISQPIADAAKLASQQKDEPPEEHVKH